MTLAVEDVAQSALIRLAGLFGRREVAVLPFIGYGTPQVVRARGRVVLGRPHRHPATADLGHPGDLHVDKTRSAGSHLDTAPDGAAPGAAARVGAARADVARVRWGRLRERWRTLRESLAPFLTVEVPRNPVTVRGPGGETVARSDRQGYLDVPVEVGGLAPGWHEVTVATSWRERCVEAAVPVLVVDPEATLAVVSDLDDTVIETGITRGLEFLRLTLLTTVTERTPLPGAAELYRALTRPRDGRDVPVFYLSSSPWNLYELLSRFLLLRGFPAGPLLLTDWGPSRTNLFRVPTQEHKLTLIRALLAEHPALRIVLVGDTGQLDPEIYAAVAHEAPDRIRAVYLRRTAGMSAARSVELHGLVRRAAACGVPMLVVEDSVQIAEHAAGLGLLDAGDMQAVRGAI